MGASPFLHTYSTSSGTGIEICIASPHQFAREQQRLLLPEWERSLRCLILILQQSSISLASTTPAIAQEKNRLRANFIRLGFSLISALRQQEYLGDLFDPRTGLPLLGNSGLVWDDNAAVKAVLNYPVISFQNCSLLQHPVWNHHVYPATIVTSAPPEIIESYLELLVVKYNWYSKITAAQTATSAAPKTYSL